jgi:inosine-uridine nucleoside N-ribohydrolase
VAVPVILDCDTGTDDAVTIMCAVLDPAIELLGVCTVWGNHDVRDTTDNSLRVLDLLGAGHVPVVPGLNGPFRGRATPLPSGRDDIPTVLDLPAPASAPHGGHAPDWLAATVAAHDEPVTVVTTGPLSNLAAAVQAHPELVDRVARLVSLVGTHTQPGLLPLVERNAWCDPEAVAAVLAAGFRELTFVGMDATFSAPLDGTDAARIRSLGTPAALAAAAMLEQRIGWYDGPAPLHDPLALALVLDPAIVTLERARGRVDLVDGPTYGRTVYDVGQEGLAVGLTADHERFVEWLVRVLGGSEPR